MNNCNLIEINEQELSLINGGESAWYWVAYGVRSAIEYLNEAGQGNQMHSAG
ncbi:hypothetical protein [Sphingobacterium sp. MYb388]|uniref:hypothetical protein n=1 Tax=Sphingobacterium sp. MYb388 TaxID=2745437 RepID=UPI0030A07584